MDEELKRRKSLTFEQAEGAMPLPSQMAPKTISSELNARLYELIYESFRWRGDVYRTLADPWQSVMYRYWVDRLHKLSDEFSSRKQPILELLKHIFAGDYLRIFGFLQWVLRLPNSPLKVKRLNEILEDCRAAYRVVENTFVPVGSESEIAAIQNAFDATKATQFSGARAHLRASAEQLTNGNFPDSIRESIHAVEAVAKALEPSASTLGDALHALEKKVKIHSALKAGFLKIYGFTSDENGIRHALIDKPEANVDETDALFMIGACASFISYLINRGHAVGLINSSN